jgi:hypothetical protein
METGRNCIMRSQGISTTKCYYTDHVKDDELGGNAACIAEMKKCMKFWLEDLKRRNHLSDIHMDERIMLKSILNK